MKSAAFCPAADLAEKIARLDACHDLSQRLLTEAAGLSDMASQDLLSQIERFSDSLLEACDGARWELADVYAISAAGALAQLLAAIRDLRVGDDAERERARDLEAKALDFLDRSGLIPAERAGRLSQTRFDPHSHVQSAVR